MTMHKRMWGSAAVLLIAAALHPVTASAAGVIRYVSTTGNDGNAGTAAAPYRTISKCAAIALAGDTCEIAAGTYRETVTPPRSGTATAPITFRAAPGAHPVIDGTDPVSGWTKDTGSIYKAPVTLSGTAAQPYSSTPYPANSDLWANQVFVNGAVSPEAAYPAPSPDPWNQAFITGGWSSTRSASGDCTTPPCNTTLTGTLTYSGLPAFGDLTGAVAYFAGGWVALSAKVTGGNLDGTNKTVQLSFPKSDDSVYPGGGNNNKFRLVGKKSFLTGANQWFYDAAAKQLYLWAPGGGVPSGVTAKKRNYAFDLRDRSFINVTSVNLWANTITTDDSSHDLVLDQVNGQYLSHWQTAQYDATLPYAGIYDANHRFDSGLLLHGTRNTYKNGTLQQSAGNGVSLKGSGHTVTNALIHDVSYGGTYTAATAIEVGSSNLVITSNTMYNIGRDAINMNTNAYPNNGYKNLRIAWNNIYGYAKISYDLGGIYVCCDTAMTGTRIDHNRIHDPANAGNGLHFDNGTYDIAVDHNVIYNLNGTGDIAHGGNGISFGGHANRPPAGSALPYLKGTIQNNVIVSGDNATIFNYFATAGHVANTTVRNNILDGSHPAGQEYAFIAGGKPVTATNLVTTRSADGTGPDPLYTNPAAGDLSVRTGSPAIDAGTVIAGITDGYAGTRPDIGAYETGRTRWLAGCWFTGCSRN
ncbi:right-handed parallel beta-helix repeat-containing protein [Kribbella sp. NPDC005582]|uniref:right-handed parallel beta-helix repeat-containing protein n=1 Tax=Kribbella sp. NPDC005582 TaxID=3156893 RepID=UPI00339F1F4D